MSQLAATQRPSTVAAPREGGRIVGLLAAFAAGCLVLGMLAVVHLTQGTSAVDAGDVAGLAVGRAREGVWDVLIGARIPRLLAGVAVGLALGVAGAAFQALARNPLASPETLGVNAGAYLAVVVAAAFGASLPVLPAGGLAFVGGLAAAALVLALSSGGTTGPTRLILAGAATAMALQSMTILLMLLHEQETTGLFAWGSGSLVQTGLDGVLQLGPVIVIGATAAIALAPRLDILALGDDAASVLGLNVRRTRLQVTLIAVPLSAAAVTLVGPFGFVGLCAPVMARLLAGAVPGLHAHRFLIAMSGLLGILIVIGSDVAVRATMGAEAGIDIPTGVATTLLGAVVLVWLARQHRDRGPARRPPAARPSQARSTGMLAVIALVATLALISAAVIGLLAGERWLLLGDVAHWVDGRAGLLVTATLDSRYPRVAAALLAGAALALAGTTVQAVCRNPLAEPGLLGITAGAGVGVVALITYTTADGVWTRVLAAGGGALVAFAVVYLLSWRGGLDSDRLVLIGVGVSAGAGAAITFMIVSTDPWNVNKALTWLSGSTYGRPMSQVLPVAIALLVLTPVVLSARRELDLLSIDDDTPRVLGVALERSRLIALGGSALLTSTAVCAVGAVGFVGLVAPHAARALVGGRHSRVLPVAVVLGALLVSVSETLGRTVIAPDEVPVGLITAMVGTPYFVWLLWRSRA